MRKTVVAGIVLLAVFVAASSAQENERQRERVSFQGRVGALFAGSEPFENGASFDIGMMVRISGALYANIYGGTSIFKGGPAPLYLSPEFEDYWTQIHEVFEISNPEPIDIRISYGAFGLAYKFGMGGIEPYALAGAGFYYTRFVYAFEYRELIMPAGFPSDWTSIQDSRYIMGANFGGGLNVAINQIIGIAGQVTYHWLNTDALDNQISVTFGLNVRIP